MLPFLQVLLFSLVCRLLESNTHGSITPSEGILNRLEKSGKITQNTGKLWEFEINII